MAKIDDSVKKIVPELRFKGFTDEWEKRNLGDVIKNQYNGQTPSRNTPSFWGGEIPWLTSGELNHGIVNDTVETITAAGQKDANLKIVPAGTFVMAITGLEAPGTRGNSSILGFDTTVNQSVMALFPNEKLDTKFLFQWYQKVGEEYGISYTQGTKQQSYNAELIKILPFTLPDTVEEQQRIAELLFKLDNLIAANQRKLDFLKEQKKGYLQKMFPKNGAKVPELRFAGFADDWEQRKLGDLAEIVRGASPRPIQNPKWFDDSSEIGWLRISDVTAQDGRIHRLGQHISVEGQEKTRVLTTPHLLLSIAATVGKPVINYISTGVHDGFLIFLKPRFELEFMFQWLENFRPSWQRYGQPGSQVNLNSGLVRKQTIYIPTREEQQKIAGFCEKLDNLITLHQRKLDLLKEQKKGFLQKMFV